MPRYYIWTIGCQMNKAESERLGSRLEEVGYQPVAAADQADIVLVNGCVVRQSAENRVINKLDALKPLKKSRPDLTLAVTGCMVDSQVDSLSKRFPHVDCFFKPGCFPEWLGDIGSWSVIPNRPSPATLVPIIQGCNNFCSYCIVPYRRGREQSRSIAEITAEVSELVRCGVKEVTLLGQNVDSYGQDLPGRPDLADLLGELNGIDGLARIRFLTNHPKDMSPRLIETVAGCDKVCEQISLPVQSGSDVILTAMRRGYTAKQYRHLVNEIRGKVPGIALSTDVVVGFPQETERQFQETFDLLAELRFDTVHVAGYSPRPGTIASREFEDDVPLAEKKRRLSRVEGLQESVASQINARLLGEVMEVLVEGRKRGKWFGRTRTDKLVFFNGNGNRLGQIVRIRVEKTSPWSLQGSEVN